MTSSDRWPGEIIKFVCLKLCFRPNYRGLKLIQRKNFDRNQSFSVSHSLDLFFQKTDQFRADLQIISMFRGSFWHVSIGVLKDGKKLS